MSHYDDIEFDTSDFEGMSLRDDSCPTIPAPDQDPIEIMRELRKALANVGELCTLLDGTLCKTLLATLTVEHKTNVLREDLEKHLADEARHLPVAAE